MKIITVEIPDNVAIELQEEADVRHVSVEEIATQKIVLAYPNARPPKHPRSKPPKIVSEEESSVFGLFADSPEIDKAIQEVISRRSEKYTHPQ